MQLEWGLAGVTVTVIPARAQPDRLPPARAVRPGVLQEETDSADSAESPGPEPSGGWRSSAIRSVAGHPLRATRQPELPAPQKVWELGKGKMKAASYLQI